MRGSVPSATVAASGRRVRATIDDWDGQGLGAVMAPPPVANRRTDEVSAELEPPILGGGQRAPARGGRRERTTVDDFGGGLGEILVRRPQQRIVRPPRDGRYETTSSEQALRSAGRDIVGDPVVATGSVYSSERTGYRGGERVDNRAMELGSSDPSADDYNPYLVGQQVGNSTRPVPRTTTRSRAPLELSSAESTRAPAREMLEDDPFGGQSLDTVFQVGQRGRRSSFSGAARYGGNAVVPGRRINYDGNNPYEVMPSDGYEDSNRNAGGGAFAGGGGGATGSRLNDLPTNSDFGGGLGDILPVKDKGAARRLRPRNFISSPFYHHPHARG